MEELAAVLTESKKGQWAIPKIQRSTGDQLQLELILPRVHLIVCLDALLQAGQHLNSNGVVIKLTRSFTENKYC
jgi:hypothetical protein